jgi:elongator complex protein 2
MYFTVFVFSPTPDIPLSFHPLHTVRSTMQVSLEHIYTGCNAISSAFVTNKAHATIGSNMVGAFGAKNAVALIERVHKQATSTNNSNGFLRISTTLQHHMEVKESTRITSVFYYSPSNGNDTFAFAGDSEGNIFLWSKESAESEWCVETSFYGKTHLTESAVSGLTAIDTGSNVFLFFVSFSNGLVVVLEQETKEKKSFKELTRLELGVKLIMESLCATTITSDEPNERGLDVVIAMAGVDSRVHLYELSSGGVFKELFALEGHRGWIRSLSFQSQKVKENEWNLLASASQDHKIRLWKLNPKKTSAEEDAPLIDGFQAKGVSRTYILSFDALLFGHEDWVTHVEWTLLDQKEQVLVSTSMDNTMIIWRHSESGAWRPSMRVGEMGGNGLLSCIALPTPSNSSSSMDLLALNFSGQLERWKQQQDSCLFLPAISLTGHTSPVMDLSWSPCGRYLLSVSLDQTARIIAPWKTKSFPQRIISWHEISRSQVHGYDINCASFLRSKSNKNEPTRYVCGADEKILRVFHAPDDINRLVQRMARHLESTTDNSTTGTTNLRQHAFAYLPELSLTNKSPEDEKASSPVDPQLQGQERIVSAINNTSMNTEGGYASMEKEYTCSGLDDTILEDVRLPVGETLGKKTLWPEIRKLYGHGNELLCVASNHDGSIFASACKSREEQFASIWLWNSKDLNVLGTPLRGHKSSVVQLAFSPDDQYLLSVSKDRNFCIFQKKKTTNEEEEEEEEEEGQREQTHFELMQRTKAHKRIIWTCAWAPCFFSDIGSGDVQRMPYLFVTGSRDQSFILWHLVEEENKWCPLLDDNMMVVDKAITAIAFAPQILAFENQKISYLLAVGLEDGLIHLYTIKIDLKKKPWSTTITLLYTLKKTGASSSITRITWQPQKEKAQEASHRFAVSSRDGSVRVFNITQAS